MAVLDIGDGPLAHRLGMHVPVRRALPGSGADGAGDGEAVIVRVVDSLLAVDQQAFDAFPIG